MMRGIWDRETVALMTIAALMPLALFWGLYDGACAIVRFGYCALIVAIWNLVFMLSRAQPPSFAAVITALAVAMLAPQDLGAFRLALGLSFGVVMGELVFGGWGRNVVNPATVAISFLSFGFPGTSWPDFVEPVVWAAIPAALIGMATGVMPAAVLISAALVGTATTLAGITPASVLPAAGIVMVLIIADPVTSAASGLGRWLNGALYAGLVTLFATGWSDADPVQMAVAAALLTSLAAPLLDEIGIAVWLANRRRRHGRT